MNTQERITQIILKNYKIDAARLTANTPFSEAGIDSLGMMELLFFIEDEFKIQLPFDPVQLTTLGEAVSYIDSLIVQQQGYPKPASDRAGINAPNTSA